MFKYPIAVTIDTNIFDEAKYDLSENSTLRLLENYVKSGKIKVILSDIVLRESKKHINDRVRKACGILRKARTDALNASSEYLINRLGLNEIFESMKNKEELMAREEALFDDFLETIHAEILGADLIDVGAVLNDYFETRPPFENSEKKKSEFPDAFIVQQIKKRFDETMDIVAVVSNDKGFQRACQAVKHHIFFESLGDLYTEINKEAPAYDETIAIINSQQSRISITIQEYLEEEDGNIDVKGLSYDNDGIESGHDYNEFCLHDISVVMIGVDSVDEITESTSIVTLSCKANISVDCSYEDYDNAIWDPEEKEYVYVDTVEVREKHEAQFECRVEIDRSTKLFNLSPFTIVLDENSLKNRYRLNDIAQKEELLDMDRKALGFQPFGNYESYLEDNLLNSVFSAQIASRFEAINSLYQKYDECCVQFEELRDKLNANDAENFVKLIHEKLSEISDIPSITDMENITDSEMDDIQAWGDAEYERMSKITNTDTLPDTFNFGDTITIRGADGNEVSFSIDDNHITPVEGSEEIIEIHFSNGNGKTVSGCIKLTVGYMDFDEDGGALNGVSDNIEYECQDILDELDSFIDAQNCLADVDTQIAEIIKEAINAST